MIEKLKALDTAATPANWFTVEEDEAGQQLSIMGPHRGPDQLTLNWTMAAADARLCCALRNLATELIGLWEAVESLGSNPADDHEGNLGLRVRMWNALDALNAKAAEVLKD